MKEPGFVTYGRICAVAHENQGALGMPASYESQPRRKRPHLVGKTVRCAQVQGPCRFAHDYLIKATVWEWMPMETVSIIEMILSLPGVGFIMYSKRRKLIEGGRHLTAIEHPWIFAGGILLTILGVLAQEVAAYF